MNNKYVSQLMSRSQGRLVRPVRITPVACVMLLLISIVGCEVSELTENDLQYIQSNFPDSPDFELAVAVADGAVKKIRVLVSDGADVNAEGNDGESHLMVAIDFKQPESIATLLELGADPNFQYSRRKSVMNWATNQSSVEVLKMLLDSGGDPDTGSDRRSALIVSAAMNGSFPKVKMLIEAGADLNGRGLNEDTALMAAARSRRFDIVYFLLEQGADYELKNRADEALADFIDARPDVNHVSGVDYHAKMIEFLRSRGVDISAR